MITKQDKLIALIFFIFLLGITAVLAVWKQPRWNGKYNHDDLTESRKANYSPANKNDDSKSGTSVKSDIAKPVPEPES